MEKLPKPYESHCQEYGNSNREYCLNNCYINGYRDKYKCIPNHNKLHTLIIDDNSTFKFCDPEIDFKNIEIILKRDCDSKCGDPCIEVLFDSSTEIMDINMRNEITNQYSIETIYRFIINDNTYTKIKFIAEITMIDLVVRLFNIWNLWHGTHLLQIMSKLNQWIGKALSKLSSIISNYNIHFTSTSKLKILTKVIINI